jgi:hypothetical protein
VLNYELVRPHAVFDDCRLPNVALLMAAALNKKESWQKG